MHMPMIDTGDRDYNLFAAVDLQNRTASIFDRRSLLSGSPEDRRPPHPS